MELLARRADSALVVIDLQDRLLPHVHGWEGVLANAVTVVRVARTLGLPVLWAEQEKLGDTAGPLRAELSGLEPVRKAHFGCLADDAFRARLNALSARTLVLVGIEAHVCVAQTALQALPRYGVQVVADAVGSRAPANREVALDRLRQAGAVVTTTEMVSYELLGRAGTEEFRALLPLFR